MYTAHFGLQKRPFASVPQVDQYFPGTAIEAARQTLVRCITRGEGPGVVVGPSGTGKTVLCQLLAEQCKDSFQVALLSCGRLSTRRALFQAILYELGRPYRGMDEGELRLALIDFLANGEDCPNGMVLLVDEAHSLPLRLVEEIRMLTNLARDAQPLVRLVLCGGCVLEERFANPKLDSFSQRLAARCYLESLNRTETQDYIHARIRFVGPSGEEIFPAETCQSVYRATDGVPRLINQVCDHALLLAYAGNRHQLDPAHIEEAWADLQQLPTPWNEQGPDQQAGAGVIEFGTLEDQPAASQTPAATGQTAAEQPTAPQLRISPETSPSEAQPVEPSEQLQRVQQMLAEVEDEFQPAGSIGPEVELVFDDPFQEEFEQEEVVTDRYATGPGPADDSTTEAPELDPDPAPETVPLRQPQPVGVAEADAEEAILVGEDCHEGVAGGRPVATARPHAYGRLFATLRRR